MADVLKVLRLGSSVDLEGETPVELRAAAIAAAMLSKASGLEVETTQKLAWPTPALPDLAERWVAEYQPDLVCLNISSFWCEGEVVARRVERHFGVLGKRLAAWIDKRSADYELMTGRLPRLMRAIAVRSIGGLVPFTPEAAGAALELTMRRLLRNEGVVLVVCGSPYSAAVGRGPFARARARRRRAELFARLRDTCIALRIPFDLPPYAPDAFDTRLRGRDGMHFGDEVQRVLGELQGGLMARSWVGAESRVVPQASAVVVANDSVAEGSATAAAPLPASRS